MTQRNLWLGSNRKDPDDLDDRLVASCSTWQNALRTSINFARIRGLKDATIADRLEIDRGHFSRIMSGCAELPRTKWKAFCYLTGNWCIYQWTAMEKRGQLYDDERDAQIAHHEEALAKLRAESA